MALAKTELRLFNPARRRKWLFFPMTYSKSITGYGEFWNYGTPFIVLDRLLRFVLDNLVASQHQRCW